MRIVAPEEFEARPWKNGKGRTLELAMNDGGSLEDFEWRISIAQVVTDGPFSDFSGYDRYLLLLEGAGMDLLHEDETTHSLSTPLDLAQFDGGSRTVATLHDGPITDFNLMTRRGQSSVWIQTCLAREQIALSDATRHLLFSPQHPIVVQSLDRQLNVESPVGHLLVLAEHSATACTAEGAMMIVIGITDL